MLITTHSNLRFIKSTYFWGVTTYGRNVVFAEDLVMFRVSFLILLKDNVNSSKIILIFHCVLTLGHTSVLI